MLYANYVPFVESLCACSFSKGAHGPSWCLILLDTDLSEMVKPMNALISKENHCVGAVVHVCLKRDER